MSRTSRATSTRGRTSRAAAVSVIFLIFAGILIGQTNRGGISGTVADANGGAVPNATVTITNLGTNQTLTLTTSNDGTFSANSLEPVEYSVLAEAPNFKKFIVERVKADLG